MEYNTCKICGTTKPIHLFHRACINQCNTCRMIMNQLNRYNYHSHCMSRRELAAEASRKQWYYQTHGLGGWQKGEYT